ncbi:hypothetical protein LTR17_007717 [Elasticomyces elasticus]|nr:hypothetical protein LTR17_007717 [Elasticomyces elasticus]
MEVPLVKASRSPIMARTMQSAGRRTFGQELRRRLERERQAVKDELRERGVRFDKKLAPRTLANMLVLSRKGMLPYSNYRRRELQRFCYARRIPIKPSMVVWDLADVLRAADAKPRFRRFFDLPAELRLLIVEAAGLDYEALLPRRSARIMAKKDKSVTAKGR